MVQNRQGKFFSFLSHKASIAQHRNFHLAGQRQNSSACNMYDGRCTRQRCKEAVGFRVSLLGIKTNAHWKCTKVHL